MGSARLQSARNVYWLQRLPSSRLRYLWSSRWIAPGWTSMVAGARDSWSPLSRMHDMSRYTGGPTLPRCCNGDTRIQKQPWMMRGSFSHMVRCNHICSKVVFDMSLVRTWMPYNNARHIRRRDTHSVLSDLVQEGKKGSDICVLYCGHLVVSDTISAMTRRTMIRGLCVCSILWATVVFL
jgi:hypothetical protein